ncbi:spermidine synthase [Gemmata sp. SH-PL17]|uniref:spermidine synthase n=1 Tax=Gemmata sp. SH-PL17 TaxID=1630693 RepID=UPI0004B65BF9|nr:fused MFS/spermidine synthase [Gemmata sp. SH-PL17]AMV23047.1 spermidine synthase [Gemmata sp. SH-PL17]
MLAVLYATTLFVGAALLFLVQPLVGKLLLPLVGGTPGVWNTCMVFFQIVLLAGYLYAHRSTGKFGVRRQAVFHLLLLAAVIVSFKAAIAYTGSPVAVVPSMLPDDQDSLLLMVARLGVVVGISIGVPFFVLSTTSPLLQRWFATTGHPAAKDPYFLYAASNAGSLLGLLAYPLLIEPRLALQDQQWVFAGGVLGYVALVVVCALTVIRNGETRVSNVELKKDVPQDLGSELVPPTSVFPVSARRIGRWVVLATLPSSLLLGVTTHISTDLAPVPLLWVVPLALYLMSFILVFARWPDSVHRVVGRVTPMLLLFVVLTLLLNAAEPLALVVLLHMAAFFGVCLVCHGELAKDRPPAEHLTAFYFWLSLGGVLGGLFNALIAPLLFSSLGMVEYPLALVLAGAVRPHDDEQEGKLRVADVVLVLVLLGLSVGLVLTVQQFLKMPVEQNTSDAVAQRLLRGGLMFGIPGVAAFALIRKPARYSLALAAILLAGALDTGLFGETLHKERNFFGVIRVTRDGKFIKLIHGTTLHGQQRADESGPPRPMTYYHQKGPVGNLFDALPRERVNNVAVVGLGTGAVASYAQPGQKWTFYEIDPAVVRIANDKQYFRFLSDCRGKCEVVLGDARRHLNRAPDGAFDVIILDGFCSDAIPVHLLTREAIALYVSKLAPNGIIALHVSNAHLNLPPLIRRLADDHSPSLVTRYCYDVPRDGEPEDGKTESQWMLLARSESDLAPVLNFNRTHVKKSPIQWDPVKLVDGPIWRDDFANLLRVWKRRGEE